MITDFYKWIVFFLLLTGVVQLQKYNIGVVGKKWFDILSKRLVERGDNNRVELKLMTTNFTIPFYEDLTENFRQLNQWKINIIIGDSSVAMAQSASYLKIPYISADPHICPSTLPEYSNMPHFISLLIPENIYANAVIDLLNKFSVKKVSVVIDSSVDYDGFVKPLFNQKLVDVRIWTLTHKTTGDLANLRNVIDQVLEESREADVWDFVVKARTNVVKMIMSRAKYYGMLVHPNKWYLPSYVCYDINIAAIRQIYSNITLINEQCSESILRQNGNYSDEAMMNKAIQIFRKVQWELTADRLYKALKVDEPITFDTYGWQVRSQFSFHSINVNESESENLRLVGMWKYNQGNSSLNYFHEEKKIEIKIPTTTRHIRVSAVEEHPHLIVLENGTMVGFGVDLLNELSSLMNFTYSITLTDSVGSLEHTSWTGIVGEIQADRADMSLGPLVQTMEVEEVIDFSTSFKQREISLVMRKPSPSTTLFQFFSPFSNNVWLTCIASLILVTLALWIVEHYHDKYFPNDAEFPMTLKESSWFAIACLLKQQIDIFPKSIPGRIIHWLIIFFSLIIITSYTANLAAFLTIKVYPNPIQSVEDLANLPKHSKIYFGTVKDSPILEFFEQSDMETIQKIHKLMRKNPKWLVNDTSSGYRRALAEPYVFIWDDSVNQYEIFSEREYECNLISVGRPFGKRSFSIGMKYNSDLIKDINLHLLHIIESGKRENLEKKWWKSKSICFASENPADSSEPLSMDEVAGVFLIVVCGAVVSIVWLSFQIIIHKYKLRKKGLQKPDYMNQISTNHDSAEIPLQPIGGSQI